MKRLVGNVAVERKVRNVPEFVKQNRYKSYPKFRQGTKHSVFLAVQALLCAAEFQGIRMDEQQELSRAGRHRYGEAVGEEASRRRFVRPGSGHERPPGQGSEPLLARVPLAALGVTSDTLTGCHQ